MGREDGKGQADPPRDTSEHPTELPRAGTATHAPVADIGFADPTASAFATTRKVSTEALRALVRARHGSAPASEPQLPAVSADFLERLRGIRRRGMDADGIEFGPYTVFGTIGRGGMAQIRLAAEALPENGIRLLVIKSLLPEHAQSEVHRDLLVEEGRVSAQLDHPNIVRMLDAGEIAGIPYLAFELVDGLSLRDLVQLIQPARVPLSAILEIGACVAAGLGHAHALRDAAGAPLNIVHRDVTPHNILVTRHGGVKIVDFGIARFSGRGVETQHGQLRGKLGYMAPEQCRTGPIDGRADVFALALTLAELISGRRVLPPTLMILQESESLIRAACADAIEPLPDALEELLVHMAEVDPNARPWPLDPVAETLMDLARVTEGPTVHDFAHRQLFNRLLPMDLSSITDPATRPVKPLGESPPPPEPDDGGYSSTMRRLRPLVPLEPTPATPVPEDPEEEVTPRAPPVGAGRPTPLPHLDIDPHRGDGPTMVPAGPWAEELGLPVPHLPDVGPTRRVAPLEPKPEAPEPPSMGAGTWLAIAALSVGAAVAAWFWMGL